MLRIVFRQKDAERHQSCFQIKCHVEDLGYPFATRVRWLHNGREIIGLQSYSLSVKEADASAGGDPFNRFSKFSCIAVFLSLATNTL